jgi:hypothetical protein
MPSCIASVNSPKQRNLIEERRNEQKPEGKGGGKPEGRRRPYREVGSSKS